MQNTISKYLKKPFSDFQAYGKTSIDYISLDLKGAELSVLQSFDFEEIEIKVIKVRTNKISSMKSNSQIEHFLRSKGYVKSESIYAKKEMVSEFNG